MSEALNAEAAMREAALLSEKHLSAAVDEGGERVGDAVPIAMLELCVTIIVDQFGHEDAASLLKDLADQILADPDRGADED